MSQKAEDFYREHIDAAKHFVAKAKVAKEAGDESECEYNLAWAEEQLFLAELAEEFLKEN